MVVRVDEENIMDAAKIHSESWMESHKDFCTKEFLEKHTIKEQKEYLNHEMELGKKFYMLVKEKPVGIVSIFNNTIENLYILPEEQQKGYGSLLLKFAVAQCCDKPTLWILENNESAYKLYYKYGFRKTGEKHQLSDEIAEIELKYV